MNHHHHQKAAQRNLSYQLAEGIGRQMLNGQIEPGSILPGEMELGEMYGVSRTAVREAVKMLAAKGMLLPRPRIGTRVMPRRNWNFLDQDLLTWWAEQDDKQKLVAEFHVMREMLEPKAASMAALHASPEDRHQLSLLMGEMRALDEQFDKERWIEVDTQFHQMIYFSSGNPFLTPFGNLFKAVFQVYFRTVTRDSVVRLECHQAIIDAILRSDPDAAAAAVESLINDKD
ncbi:FadR/GntR family transcriptional regulator [Plesiomonas sp.]|uniref:FadR/GntR family transcriptional regulator n=1 Tax=Plesiomonas sp. TaxID=2486279 RepID=UPI003F2E16B6